MANLPLSDIVGITVNISPTATARSGFNLGLIMGKSTVISTSDRVKLYSGLSAMITDGFTTGSAEYIAAQRYFSQSPPPTRLAVGRWNDATESVLTAIQACRDTNSDWYGFTVCAVTAAEIAALATWAESASPVSYYFYTTSDADVLNNVATGAGTSVSAASPSTNISAGSATTFKIAADGDCLGPTPNYQSVTLTLAGLTTGALIAAAIQTEVRKLGGYYSSVTCAYTTVYTITSGTAGKGSQIKITAGDTNDVAAALKLGTANSGVETAGVGSIFRDLAAKSFRRTQGQYSTGADAVAAILGYACGANTAGANTAFTLAFKTEVGVTPEVLTLTQVANFKAYNGNYYITRGATYKLYERGVSASGAHFDEVLGVDMLTNYIQVAVMDLLAGVRKVPQTEAGVSMLVNAIKDPCEDALKRGFIAPGVWNAASVLNLETGATLVKGYLILSESIADQTQSQRSQRIAPTIYVCVKEAGAVENVVIQLNVNQ